MKWSKLFSHTEPTKPVAPKLRERKEITLNQKDDDLTRAEKILISAGIRVSDDIQTQWMPWMARAIVAYQELDKERWRWEWEQEQKKKEEQK